MQVIAADRRCENSFPYHSITNPISPLGQRLCDMQSLYCNYEEYDQ